MKLVCEAEPGARLASTYAGIVIAEPSGRVRLLRRDGRIEVIVAAPLERADDA